MQPGIPAAGHPVLPFLWQQRHLVPTLGPRPSFPDPLVSSAWEIEHFRLQRGFQTHLHLGVAGRLGLFTSGGLDAVPPADNNSTCILGQFYSLT